MAEIKNGDEKAAVVLALVGDTDLPNAICEPLVGDGTVGAEPAPRLRQFAEYFTYGTWCSVCSPDFTPCFEDAVSVINAAWDGNVIQFDMEAADGGGSWLSFAHRGFGRADQNYAAATTRWGYYIVSLRRYLQTGKGMPNPDDTDL